MKKRRVAALFMAAAMAVTGMTGCGSSDTATTEAAKQKLVQRQFQRKKQRQRKRKRLM